MNDKNSAKFYSRTEEFLNIFSHALGLALSIAALVLLVVHAAHTHNAWRIVSFTIFGSSLVILYAASTVYHSTTKLSLRKRLRIVDHAAIFVLIAGTYTPFTLVTLNGVAGWIIFGCSWGLAVTGIVLKLFFTGRFKIFSTLMYVFMGWIVVFVFKPLIQNFSHTGLWWLAAGGLAYTIGAVLYSIKRIPLNHAIFHVLVLVGSACHFMAIYQYV